MWSGRSGLGIQLAVDNLAGQVFRQGFQFGIEIIGIRGYFHHGGQGEVSS
jgi:hypothetical protein